MNNLSQNQQRSNSIDNRREGRNQSLTNNVIRDSSNSQERNLQASELYYAQNSQSPLKTQQSKASTNQTHNSQQFSKIDLRQSNLDSRIMLAQQMGQPFLLETISSNDSRFTSSPNFLARSKESFHPGQFAGSSVGQSIIIQNGFNGNGTQNMEGQMNLIQDFNNLGGNSFNRNAMNSGGIGQQTQIIRVPALNTNKFGYNHFESISQSASSEFGQHSLRSSVEQQNSQRGFHMADQIRMEQYQVKNYQNPMTILEESKEEDVSFNKTLTDQSPIPVRGKEGGPYNAYNSNNLTGTGGVYFDNKSSIDDGTRSLLMHMRGVPGMESQDHSATLGSQGLRNASILGGGNIAGNAKPNFNISSGTLQNGAGGHFMKFMGTTTPQKSSTQFLNGQKLGGTIQDQELLDELGKANLFDPKASTQQQLMSSLQVSDELVSNSHMQRQSQNEDFNVIDEIGSARQDLQSSQFNSDVKDQRGDKLEASHIGSRNTQDNQNNLMYQTFKNNNGQQQQHQVKNDPIRIDDNQFVTLNQIPEDGNYYGQKSQYQEYSGRPSTLSQYGNQYFNYRREISNASQLSQKCQCCQAPMQPQYHNRPLSGLSQIETKNLNFYDKNADTTEVQTPQLASEVDQSTKILSNKGGSEQVSSYKAVLCNDCQNRILNKENFTPIAPSDLKTSELTNSNIMVKSHIRNFDELQINSNLSSIHHYPNNQLANSSIQGFNNNNNPSQLNHLKFTSSIMGQSELQSSYLTQSNANQLNHANPAQNSFYPQNSNLLNQQTGVPLQMNSLLQNSDQITNPALQSSSLHYLSYLSSNLGSQLKQSDQQLTQKYGLNTQDNYKVTLKSYMQRQFEKSASQSSSDSGNIQYSRIFRERQTKRIFDQLQNIKTDYAKTYEELEAMHTGLLLGKISK
eukprot:403355205